MYRLGLSQSRIAAVVERPERTVAYHLRLARAAEPELRQHALARPVAKQSAHSDLEEAIHYVQNTGSLPPAKPTDNPRERIIARWYKNWRRQGRDGTLAPEYRSRLNEAVPGWDLPKADKESTSGSRSLTPSAPI